MAGIYHDGKYDKQRTFYNKQSLINFFQTRQFRNSYICATNLGFDFMAVFHETPEMQFFDLCWRGSDLIFARAKIKSGKFTREKEADWSITFIDTMSYCRESVEKLGNSIGLKKMEKPVFLGRIPETKEQEDYLKEYNMRDAEVSFKFMKFLFSTFSILGANPKYTIASTAMSLFRNKIGRAHV